MTAYHSSGHYKDEARRQAERATHPQNCGCPACWSDDRRVPRYEDQTGAITAAADEKHKFLWDGRTAVLGMPSLHPFDPAHDNCPMCGPAVPHLPDDSDARKAIPMATGLLDYFPDALAEVSRLSKVGNDKHNPGQPLHWSRGKSNDHADTIMRHMVDRGKMDTDGFLHDVKVAWRALAQLQLALEAQRK